jgi:hypothetical protein
LERITGLLSLLGLLGSLCGLLGLLISESFQLCLELISGLLGLLGLPGSLLMFPLQSLQLGLDPPHFSERCLVLISHLLSCLLGLSGLLGLLGSMVSRLIQLGLQLIQLGLSGSSGFLFGLLFLFGQGNKVLKHSFAHRQKPMQKRWLG